MTHSVFQTKKLVLTAIFVAAGIVLQVAEQMLPLMQTIPGGKLGLANVVSAVGILLFGGGYGISIAVIRSLLGCLLFGGISALPYSLCGAVLSSCVMSILICNQQKLLSMIGIGIIGASVHNIAQILVASLILSNGYLWTYLPVLLLLSLFSGSVVGTCAAKLKNYFAAHKLI